ncbi:MAG: hypothetical protein ABEJ65_03830, partial [bacterium]
AVKWGFRAIRRGRWFRQIKDSVVSWEPTHKTNLEWRSITIANGRVARRESIKEAQLNNDQPVPESGKGKLSIESFDRLRVLTTELKRLSKSNSSINLHLNNKQVLSGEKLVISLQKL